MAWYAWRLRCCPPQTWCRQCRGKRPYLLPPAHRCRRCSLPYAPRERRPSTSRGGAHRHVGHDTAAVRPSTILIVDDDPFNVDYLEQELEELGYVTVSARNGREALDQGLFAIIWAGSKSFHNQLISVFSGCVHFVTQRPAVESA